ncbi:Gfo/Idh/MocA family protein [Lichenifustis flavocetrariae]|uniref:Gfo/Idh/MocA family oxidoreductase n=1 Tax=Lichenifustis flavocetrariae TaxID=2949735 RepID=A0AA42CN84_9HYPH|nr:Gfo/Idh/MocA family oxidoreductase [Lichenifustis flavocetrariae]MCW6509152.1 Gfo/Idh/MocA family oxidoreductase [Lichenifustis flavocetrariae]
MSQAQRILILGTGHIAHKHAEQFGSNPGCTLVAAVDANGERARAYASSYGIPHVFEDLEAAIRWNGFDAAVNATPDAVHKPTSLRLIAAGKSVFCEKPLALTEVDAFEMTEAAEAAGIIAMVNLTYRNAHAIQRARQMIDAGEIGIVRHIEASYLQSWLTASHWGDWRTEERWLWRLSTAHGSNGVLGDIGIHLVDFVTFGTGLDVATLQARLKTFDKAEGGRIGAYRLDANDSVAVTAEMSNGALASIHMTRFATGKLNDLNLAIYGTGGALKVWANHLESRLDACLGADMETQSWRTLPCPETPRNEARFVTALQAGRNGDPTFRRAAEMQRLLDLCLVSGKTGHLIAVRDTIQG